MNVYQHFGLTGPPFSVTPDPRFAYATKEHQLSLVKIAYSVDERRGIFLLQGEVGTGKTTLGRYLLHNWSAESEKYTAAHLNTPTTRSQAGFLREIMDAFGLDTPRNFAALERILLAFLLEGRLAGKIVVLLLDEAQNIAVPNLDLLHRLSNLQTVEEQLLQIVLLAQPNFTNKLDQRPALRSRITGGTYLGPLSFDDAIEMLRHRIGVAGGDFDKVFLKETHKPLYNATQGICRDLCVCADAALVGAFARNSRVVNVDVLKEAIRDMSFKGWTK